MTYEELRKHWPNASVSFLRANSAGGATSKGQWNPWSLEEDAKLASLMKEGLTLDAISMKLDGRTAAAVACRASELKLTRGRDGVDLQGVNRVGQKESIVCAHCGVSFVSLAKHQRRFCSIRCSGEAAGPALRSRAKAARMMFDERKCLQCGKPFTPTSKCPNKLHCSMTCAQSNPEVSKRRINSTRANPNAKKTSYATCARGWRVVGNHRFYARSSWEANYARYLQFMLEYGQISSWEHEPHTFWFDGIKRGTRSYLPDFKVVLTNGCVAWHEVKGWLDGRSKTQLKRMAKYFPNETVILIDGKRMKEINRTVGRFIKNWESPKTKRKA